MALKMASSHLELAVAGRDVLEQVPRAGRHGLVAGAVGAAGGPDELRVAPAVGRQLGVVS